MGRCPLVIPLALLIALIMLGWYPGSRHPSEPTITGTLNCSARILNIREAETAGRLAIVEIDTVNGYSVAPFKARIHLLNEAPVLTAGQELSFCSEFKPLPRPIDIPDARDLQAELRRQGITVTTELLSDSIHNVADTNGLLPWLRRLNAKAFDALSVSPLSNQSIDMLAAMLLGDAQYITTDTRNIYSAAGISHILALSGMHVGVITMIITMALWPLYFTRHKRTRLLLTIIALWAYAAFTAFSPSVTRAVIMASIYLGGRIMQRHSVAMNSLCMAAILILAFNPTEIYSLGFQLSFGAVAGIILFFPLINRVNRREHPRLYWLVSFPAMSVSAMAFAGVISAFHFHTFPILFIFSNILIAPLVPLFIVSGLISMTFHVTAATDFIADAIEWVARTTASLQVAQIDGLYPSAIITLLIIVTLVCVAYTRRYWLVAIPALVIFTLPAPQYPERERFIITDARHVYLVDKVDSHCLIYSNANLPSERIEAHQLYSLILHDYLCKRGIDSLRMLPKDSLPIEIIHGRACSVLLDSCSPGKIAYEPRI